MISTHNIGFGRATAIVLLVSTIVIALVALVPTGWRATVLPVLLNSPFWCGLIAMGMLWILHMAITDEHPWKLIEGEDGRASSSKAQLWLWTAVAIYAYVAMTVARINAASAAAPFAPIDAIPAGLLLVMGFSSATAVAAKGITGSYVASGRVSKTAASDGQSMTDLVCNDRGEPDLLKFQMLAWTLVAIGVFLVSLYEHIYGPKPNLTSLPDVDEALAVLMGIGHGSYVFNKLTLSNAAMITALAPAIGNGRPLTVKIQGSGFGASADGSAVTIDGSPVDATGWSDTEISVPLPTSNMTGPAWVAGKRVQIGVTINGLASNTLLFVY